MVKVARSVNIVDSPERIWAVISDFPRWDRLLHITDPQKKGWGNSFVVRAGSERGMELAMLDRGKLVQDWVVEDWSPGKRLRIASRKFYGDPRKATEASIDFTVAPAASAGQTNVNILFEARFTHPTWGWFMNVFPLKSEFARFVGRMERGLLEALAGG